MADSTAAALLQYHYIIAVLLHSPPREIQQVYEYTKCDLKYINEFHVWTAFVDLETTEPDGTKFRTRISWNSGSVYSFVFDQYIGCYVIY